MGDDVKKALDYMWLACFILSIMFACMIWGVSGNLKELKNKMEKLEKKVGILVDSKVSEDEFIKSRFDYVFRYTKDKIYTYRILKAVKKYSEIFKVDADLVIALIVHESSFDSSVISPKGAVGLMQLMPETAEIVARLLNKFGYRLTNVEDNIELGVGFLAILLEYNTREKALQKYYAGGLWDTDLAKRYRMEVLQKYVSLKNLMIEKED